MEKHILKNMILTPDAEWKTVGSEMPEEPYTLHWLHMNREDIHTQKWLYEQEIDEPVIESLTDADSRPRTTVFQNGILLNMRAVNTSSDDEPHNMLSMRMYIQKNRIISTSLSHIHILKDMQEMIDGEYAPANKSEFLAYLIEMITDRMEVYIADNKDIIYDMECSFIDRNADIKQSTISEIRRAVLTFARFMSPQKDALVKLLTLKENIFTPDDRVVVTESIHSTSRFLEDLDSLHNRCHILKDDMNSLSAEKMNKNMYMLSIITAVFLPLSFLTGLLGVNLGGIPGAENVSGFKVFSIILAVVLVIQIAILRISKRF